MPYLWKKEKLSSSIVGLEKEVTLLKSKLNNMTKYARMLNNGSNMLDEILEIGGKNSIDFNYISMNKKVKIHTKNLVAPEKKIEFLMKDHMSQHPA